MQPPGHPAMHGCGLRALCVAVHRASRVGSCRGDRSGQLSLTELSLPFLSQWVFSDGGEGQLSERPPGVDCADRALVGSTWSQAPVCSQFSGDGQRLAWGVSGAGRAGQERPAAPFSADGR